MRTETQADKDWNRDNYQLNQLKVLTHCADVVATHCHRSQDDQRHPDDEIGADDKEEALGDDHLVLTAINNALG
jgi:hypothetical protein